MTPLVLSVTNVLAAFTLIGIVGAVFLLVLLVFGKGTTWYSFLGRHSVLFSFCIALFGMASSLFYSEAAHFTPCTLCVWQRIFLYPQVLLFGFALWKRYARVWRIALPMSAAGLVVAVYQVYLQFGGAAFIACSADSAASCAKRYFLAYGFVTIPVMALLAFLLLVLFQFFAWKGERIS